MNREVPACARGAALTLAKESHAITERMNTRREGMGGHS
jgi:hypothetical protein